MVPWLWNFPECIVIAIIRHTELHYRAIFKDPVCQQAAHKTMGGWVDGWVDGLVGWSGERLEDGWEGLPDNDFGERFERAGVSN